MTQRLPSTTRRLACTLAVGAAALLPQVAHADIEAIAPDGSNWTGVFICPDVKLERECARRAKVSLDPPDARLAPTSVQAQERRVEAFLERGPILRERQLITPEGRAPMEAGMESDPALKWQVRHEFLVILAELANRPALRQYVARYQLKPDVEELRGIRVVDELEHNHDRGTWLEIEERLGSDRVGGLSGTAVVVGAALFGTGAAATAVSDSPPANTTHAKIRPKVGTPGIKLKGQFDFF